MRLAPRSIWHIAVVVLTREKTRPNHRANWAPSPAVPPAAVQRVVDHLGARARRDPVDRQFGDPADVLGVQGRRQPHEGDGQRDHGQHGLQGERPGVAEAVGVAEADEGVAQQGPAAVAAQRDQRLVAGELVCRSCRGSAGPWSRCPFTLSRSGSSTVSAPGLTSAVSRRPGATGSPSSSRCCGGVEAELGAAEGEVLRHGRGRRPRSAGPAVRPRVAPRTTRQRRSASRAGPRGSRIMRSSRPSSGRAAGTSAAPPCTLARRWRRAPSGRCGAGRGAPSSRTVSAHPGRAQRAAGRPARRRASPGRTWRGPAVRLHHRGVEPGAGHHGEVRGRQAVALDAAEVDAVRGAAQRRCRAPRPGCSGRPRLRASRLPVPQGATASGTPVPASASAAARTVPSPPQTTTSDAPSAHRPRRLARRPGRRPWSARTRAGGGRVARGPAAAPCAVRLVGDGGVEDHDGAAGLRYAAGTPAAVRRRRPARPAGTVRSGQQGAADDQQGQPAVEQPAGDVRRMVHPAVSPASADQRGAGAAAAPPTAIAPGAAHRRARAGPAPRGPRRGRSPRRCVPRCSWRWGARSSRRCTSGRLRSTASVMTRKTRDWRRRRPRGRARHATAAGGASSRSRAGQAA